MALPAVPVIVTHKGRPAPSAMAVPLQRTVPALTSTVPSERSQATSPPGMNGTGLGYSNFLCMNFKIHTKKVGIKPKE
jgi:hypothetical protein